MLFVLWLVQFTVASQFLLIAPLLPRIEETLHVPEEWLGWLVTGYALGVGVTALISGPVSDAVGRRRVLLFGTAAMAMTLLAHGLTDDFWSLFAARLVAGICSGAMSGAAAAYVGDVFPYARRGWAMGWVMSGMAFGQIAGVPVGSFLASRMDFRVPFLLLGGLMLLANLLATVVIVDPSSSRSGHVSVRGGLRIYRELLVQRKVQAVCGSGLTMMLGVSLYVVYQPQWLEQHLGATPDQVAGMFLAGGVANALVTPVAGRLSDRIGRKVVIVLGSVGVGLLMAITPQIPGPGWAYAVFFLVMSFAALRISPLNALLTALVAAELRGTMLALSMAVSQVGFALGSAVAGLIYMEVGYAGDALVGACASIVAGLLVLLLVPEPPRDTMTA